MHVGQPNHQGLWNSRVLRSDEVGDVLDPSSVIGALACSGSVTAVVRNHAPLPCSGDDSQHSSATMFGRFAHCRTNTTLGLICNIAPLPCCSDSHTPMLRVCLLRYQAVRLPPVSVFTTLVPQSRSSEQHTWCSHSVCLASRVACVRAWSWLSHPRPPDRSQHGCTVGVLPGPTRVLPMPRKYGISRRAPTRAVLVSVLWCAYTVCGLCRQYVLYCVLSHPSSTWS